MDPWEASVLSSAQGFAIGAEPTEIGRPGEHETVESAYLRAMAGLVFLRFASGEAAPGCKTASNGRTRFACYVPARSAAGKV